MSAPILAISAHADFEPADAPEGFIEWTFLVAKNGPIGAGLYELRFLRILTADERETRDYTGMTQAEAEARGLA